MYEERKKKFNWKGFIIKLLLLIIVVFLIIKLLPHNNVKDSNGHSKVFNTNFTKFKEVGNNFFTKDKLPVNDTESKITLKELVKEKKISTLKGSDKNTCNEDESYIRAYKKNIGYELEVYLECGEENDKSYIYLGCFDDCKVTTKTKEEEEEKTTTSKKTTTKSSNNETTKKITTTKKTSSTNNNSSSNKTNTTTTYKTVTKVVTTTLKVKKYAVIFNENGGSKVTTQNIIEGKTAIKPNDPTKEGFTFKGWYLNGQLYDFNTPVNNNIILMAKWEIADNTIATLTKKTLNETVYSAVSINKDNKIVSSKSNLTIPNELKNKTNVKIKNITYIRNLNNNNDINILLNNNTNFNEYTNINNYGTIDNVEINVYSNNCITWNGLVQSSCKTPINNTCAYGIVYRVTWEYME